MKDEYTVIEDFQVGKMRILVLDADYEFGGFNRVLIDGQEYSFSPNSIKNWIVIETSQALKNKRVRFIRK